MSKYDDIVRETVLEVLEEIEAIFDDSEGDSSRAILRTIKEELADKFNVVVELN